MLPLFAAARLSSADAYTKQEITSPRVGQLGARSRQPCVATMVQAKQRTFATRDYHVPVGQTARTCTLPHNSAMVVTKSSLVTSCGLLIGCLGPLVDDLEGDAISVRVTQRTNADSRNIDRGYAATQRVALTCTTQDWHNPGCAIPALTHQNASCQRNALRPCLRQLAIAPGQPGGAMCQVHLSSALQLHRRVCPRSGQAAQCSTARRSGAGAPRRRASCPSSPAGCCSARRAAGAACTKQHDLFDVDHSTWCGTDTAANEQSATLRCSHCCCSFSTCACPSPAGRTGAQCAWCQLPLPLSPQP